MALTIIALVFFLVPVAFGLWLVKRERTHPAEAAVDRSGWIYFATGEDEDMPVRVGSCEFKPVISRLPELGSGSAVPLKIVFSAFVEDRFTIERLIHEELEPYQHHAHWFDRDVALAWADNLKGALVA